MHLPVEVVLQQAFETSLILAFDNSIFFRGQRTPLLRNKLSRWALVIRIGDALKAQDKAIRRAKH
jgi:hypothetical protein